MADNDRRRGQVWLWLCAISLGCYLVMSPAMRGFLREVSRLVDKL